MWQAYSTSDTFSNMTSELMTQLYDLESDLILKIVILDIVCKGHGASVFTNPSNSSTAFLFQTNRIIMITIFFPELVERQTIYRTWTMSFWNVSLSKGQKEDSKVFDRDDCLLKNYLPLDKVKVLVHFSPIYIYDLDWILKICSRQYFV